MKKSAVLVVTAVRRAAKVWSGMYSNGFVGVVVGEEGDGEASQPFWSART